MFTKTIKQTIAALALTGALVIASIQIIAFGAWGPATTPHDGISYKNYPAGYKSANDPVVSFNNYMDFPAEYDDPNDPNKKIYYGPIDEREFLWVVEKGNEAKMSRTFSKINFKNPSNLTPSSIKEDDILTFWVYIHNNAAPGDDATNYYEGKNNKSGAARAQNTTLKIDLGEAGKTVKPKAFISASNATPQEIWTDATINLPEEYSLEHIPTHTSIMLADEGWTSLTVQQEEALFNNGVKIKSEGDLNWGTWRGCSEHQTWLVFDVKVKKKPLICKSLSITPRVLADGKFCANIEGDYKGQLAWDITGRGKMIGEDMTGGSVRTTVDTTKSRESCITVGGIVKDSPTKLTVKSSQDACQDEIQNKVETGPICEELNLYKSGGQVKYEDIQNGTVCAKITKGEFTGDLEWTLTTPNTDAILDIGYVGEGTARKQITGKTVRTSVDTTRQIKNACATIRNLKDSDTVSLSVKATGPQAGTCQVGLAKTPPPVENACESLKITPSNLEKDGEYCVTIDKGTYSGNLEWTSKNADVIKNLKEAFKQTTQINSKGDNKSCLYINIYDHEDTSELSVRATDKGGEVCKVDLKRGPPPSEELCKEVSFIKRPHETDLIPGEYCVKAYPSESYKGPMRFKITGQGAFKKDILPTIDPNLNNPRSNTTSLKPELLTSGPTATISLPKLEQNPEYIATLKNDSWCATVTGVGKNASMKISPTDTKQPAICSREVKTGPTPPPPSEALCQELTWITKPNFKNPNSQTIEVSAKNNDGSAYTGSYEWNITGKGAIQIFGEGIKITSQKINVIALEPDSTIAVRATGKAVSTNACAATLTSEKPKKPTFKKQPEIIKRVRYAKDGDFAVRATVPFNEAKGGKVEYKVVYDFETNEPVDVNITDDIGKTGSLPGSKGGKIEYKTLTNVFHDETRITPCKENEAATGVTCFDGSIGDPSGIMVFNATKTIEIIYVTETKSVITEEYCNELKTQNDCAERFFNRARGVVVINRTAIQETLRESNNTQVMVPCRFFLTRAGGDVFFEEEFGIGVDPLYCGRRSTTGIILKRRPEEQGRIPQTGTGETQNFSHKACQLSGIKIPKEKKANPKLITEGDLPEGFDKYLGIIQSLPAGYLDPIEDFSSIICEIQIATASDLNKDFIKAAISENVKRIARWNENLSSYNDQAPITENIFTTITDPVLRKKGNLTISSLDLTKITEAGKTLGAKTFIIEGDLTINGDIKYPILENITNPRSVPSLAFIVLGGDIKVAPNVKELSGVFFVQANETDKGGRIMPTQGKGDQPATSDKQLKIYGQVFGDIKELFKSRLYSGDPRKDEGAITIYYDQRIILNTPPGLDQLIDMKQVEIAG